MSKVRFDAIASELMQRISAGHHPVGSLLPTELELCTRYGTSRHTVRAALAELQEAGLVSRRRNVGTRVEATTASPAFHQSLGSVDDLIQFGVTHVRSVRAIKNIVAGRALAKTLRCAAGSPWLHIGIVRMVEEEGSVPLSWTDVYVDGRYAEIRDLVLEQPEVLTSTLIERQYGRRIARVEQEVQAVAMPAKLADVLGTDAGTPALRIVRRYLDAAAEAFEVSVSIHPGDRYTLSTQLQRRG
jgi:DNA-binding GntR family transcriptional regulator